MDQSDEIGAPRPPPRLRRRQLLWAAALLLLTLGTLLAFWRPILIGGIELALRTRGLGPFDARIADLDWDRLVLEDVALGPGASVGAARATVGFSLSDRRLLDIELIRPHLHGRLVDGRLAIPALDPLLGETDADDTAGGPLLPSLPFRSLRVEAFDLRLSLADGEARASGDVRLKPAPSGLEMALETRIDMPDGRAAFVADGTLTEENGILAVDGRAALADLETSGVTGSAGAAFTLHRGADGNGSARITLTDGRFALGENTVQEPQGTVELELAEDTLRSVTVDLGFRSAAVGTVALSDGRVAGTWRDGRLDARLDLPWQGGRLQADVAFPTDDGRFPLRLEADGEVDAGWLSSLTENGAVTADGRLTVAAELHGGPPAALLAATAAADWFDRVRGEITISTAALDVTVPEVLRTGPIAGRAVVGVGEGRVTLTLPDGLRTPAARLAPALHAALPPPLAPVLAAPVQVDLAGVGNGPAATLEPDGNGGHHLSTTVRLGIAGNGAKASLEARGRLELGTDFGIDVYRFETADLTVDRFPVGDLRTSGRLTARDLTGSADRLEARLDLTLRADGRPHPAFEVDGSRLTAAGHLDWRGTDVTFTPASGRIDSGSVQGKLLEMSEAAAIDLDRQRSKPIHVDLATGTLETDITLTAPPFHIAVLAADPPVELVLRLGRVRLSGSGAAVRLRATGGGFDLPDHHVEGRGLAADIAIRPGGDHTGRIELAELRHAVPVPWFIPLSLVLNSRGRGDRITFDGRLADAAARFAFDMQGEHRLSSGRGHADLHMPDILFLPTVLHPRQLFPVIEASIREFDGTLGMTGRFTWDPDGIRSSGGLSFAVRQASSGEIVLENATMNLEFDNLAPPTTPPGQRITFDRLVASLPFTNGAIDLQLMPGGRVVAEIAQLDLFGGRITTDSVILDPGAATTAVTLEVDDIDLERLMAFSEFGELVATGKLRGTLPVVLRSGGMTIRDGRLGTTGPGHLRYVPKGVGPALEDANEATDVLMQVVRDFDYESIEVGIDEDEDGEMTIIMRIDGKSPKVYGGLPVILNLDISGPLQKIIADALRPYQLPSDIQERIQRQPPR